MMHFRPTTLVEVLVVASKAQFRGNKIQLRRAKTRGRYFRPVLILEFWRGTRVGGQLYLFPIGRFNAPGGARRARQRGQRLTVQSFQPVAAG